ncbi:hypothetical protein HDU76_006543, partial [Blyttiomyces sp. JEL0837]
MVLADFGLATSDEWSFDLGCGSVRYMAPECQGLKLADLLPPHMQHIATAATNRDGYASKPNDVWSLGIILINLLFSRNPWHSPSDPFCSKTYLQEQQPVLVREFGLSNEMDAILRRCFDPNPRTRCTVMEFREMVCGVRDFVDLELAVRAGLSEAPVVVEGLARREKEIEKRETFDENPGSRYSGFEENISPQLPFAMSPLIGGDGEFNWDYAYEELVGVNQRPSSIVSQVTSASSWFDPVEDLDGDGDVDPCRDLDLPNFWKPMDPSVAARYQHQQQYQQQPLSYQQSQRGVSYPRSARRESTVSASYPAYGHQQQQQSSYHNQHIMSPFRATTSSAEIDRIQLGVSVSPRYSEAHQDFYADDDYFGNGNGNRNVEYEDPLARFNLSPSTPYPISNGNNVRLPIPSTPAAAVPTPTNDQLAMSPDSGFMSYCGETSPPVDCVMPVVEDLNQPQTFTVSRRTTVTNNNAGKQPQYHQQPPKPFPLIIPPRRSSLTPLQAVAVHERFGSNVSSPDGQMQLGVPSPATLRRPSFVSSLRLRHRDSMASVVVNGDHVSISTCSDEGDDDAGDIGMGQEGLEDGGFDYTESSGSDSCTDDDDVVDDDMGVDEVSTGTASMNNSVKVGYTSSAD